MVARYAGAGLGLLAFAIALVAGMATRNPFSVVLSRGILALFLFCVIGLFLGLLAQRIVAEHGRERERDIRASYAARDAVGETQQPSTRSGGGEPPVAP